MQAVWYFVRFLRQTNRTGQIEEFRRGQEVLEGFVNACRERGYRATYLAYTRTIAHHFIGWLHTCQMTIDTVSEELAQRFIAHDCVCVLPSGWTTKSHAGKDYVVNTRKIINYILGREFIPEIYRHPTKQSGHELQDFREWIRRHRGVKPRTVSERVRIVLTLLPDLGEDPEQYDASLIRNVLLNHVAKHSRKYAKSVVTSMRQYLRFLATTNRCRPGLENAVPSVPEWRLSSLPRYISDDEVNRVVASCNLNTPVGIRNHAILLLLSRLGLRAQDIVNLRIDDIDWHHGSIRVTGKSARTANLPLPQDVGDALLLYIEKARPRATEERVFMCVRAPHRPFAGSGAISRLVFYALKRAGVTSPSNQGAHLLRHSAATSMLRSGAGLDTVGAILRHGSHDTTAIYAKVDVRMLKEITQPWIADA